MTAYPFAPGTALFLPASNARAIAKARGLESDMVLLDLEDAVAEADKDPARAAAVEAVATGFGERLTAIRMNGIDHAQHKADIAAIAGSSADFAILPKAEDAGVAGRVANAVEKPLMVMIETPRGVAGATAIAEADGVVGLIAGTNDLRSDLGIPAAADRAGLTLALQTIVLAARVGGCWALDGVFNGLDDAEGLAAECRAGRAMGFDGKTLIHPNQIAVAAEAFRPSAAEIEEAEALIAAAGGGAERFRGRMIEVMHVEQARRLIARRG